LPCSYSADVIIELPNNTVTGTFYTAGKLVAIIGTAQQAALPMPIPMQMAYRPDVLADGKPVQARATQTPLGSLCAEVDQPNLADVKMYLNYSFPYDSVETGQKWKGIDCDLYHLGADYSVCATSTMRVVGLNTTAGLVTFDNYTLNTDDLTVFAIGESYTGCTHAGVYEVPETDPCNDESSYNSGHSSSSSSSSKGAASTINVFASVILAMVMGVLLMVF